MEAALELGAEDVISNDDGSLEVITAPTNDFIEIKNGLEAKGFKSEIAEVVMKAESETELTGEDAQKMQRLLDAFDELDDVQDVYTTVVLDI